MRVFLIGFSGSGKSTVGPALAKLLKCEYVDTDNEIEREAGSTIPGIFKTKGERHFRRLEREHIQSIIESGAEDLVVGLGGGAFTSAANREWIQSAGYVVYLRCSVEELYRRLSDKSDRPLLKSGDGGEELAWKKRRRIRKLLDQRKRYYEMADVIVSTSNHRPREVAKKIRDRLVHHAK